MNVCYLLQTHKNPDQIYRLVRTLKLANPDAQVIISHDFTKCDLNKEAFQEWSNIQIVTSKGGRGNFSVVQTYLDAVDWLLSSGSDFDWLINLSGQDYPIQPICHIESFLSETDFDGFMLYFEVFSKQSHWKIQEGYTRYCYRYRTIVNHLSEWQKWILRPIKLLNYVQPFFRINFSYGITFGLRTSTPFNQNFICYGGSFLCTLSRKCVEYLYSFVASNPDLVEYYQGVAVSDESFIQTILVNSQLFKLDSDCKRYFDFSRTQDGHPCILSTADIPALAQSQAHFARKFDISEDSHVLDLIDSQLLQSPSVEDAETFV